MSKLCRLLFFLGLNAVASSAQPTEPRPTVLPTKRPAENILTRPTRGPTKIQTPRPTGSEAIKELLDLLKLKIVDTINRNRRIGATYLRLDFHDCFPNGSAGGCDGCVNLAHPANKGLKPAIDTLAPIVAEFEGNALNVTRADIWAFASLVAVEVARSTLVFTDDFKVGRKTCETAGTCPMKNRSTCASFGPDVPSDFPSTDFTTHQLLDFMNDHFGYTADETVAIMGAHTIGRALPDNSGFEGKWVRRLFILDNEYYKQLAGNPTVVTNPLDWRQIMLPASGRFQWMRNPDIPLMMLNVDIALVRDLGSGKLTGSKANCVFRANTQKSCPMAKTMTKVGLYSSNKDEWLSDFKKVLNIMINKGLV